MTLEIRVGPPNLTVHQGYTVMVSDRDGQIPSVGQDGLYFLDTRLICVWTIFADGVPWRLLNGGSLTGSSARVFCTNAEIHTSKGVIPEKSLGLSIGRHIDGGMHEDLCLTNYGMTAASISLELVIRSDFADLFEVKGKKVTRRGQIEQIWSSDTESLTLRYSNADFSRALRVRGAGDSPMTYANGRLGFDIELQPGATWRTCLLYDFADGERWNAAPAEHIEDADGSTLKQAAKRWSDEVLKLESSNNAFSAAFAQAVDDMSALRLPMEGDDHLHFVPAAGLPWFVALFGRYSLVISIQSVIVHPEFAKATLRVLGRWQARERDDYRDAEPGKIPHELRRGELAHFRLIPHTPYYGTADATILYIIALLEAWKWLGDDFMFPHYKEVVWRCLEWIDHYGDRDGDGFQEYQTRSAHGYENMGWKDAGDAVLYPDGSLVKGPKALCELQGYVYAAWLGMAELYAMLGNGDRAAELRRRAAELFNRFNDVFW